MPGLNVDRALHTLSVLSEYLTAELEGNNRPNLELVDDFLNVVIVCVIAQMDFAVVRVDFGFAMELNAHLEVHTEKVLGDCAAETDADIWTEALYTETTLYVTVLVNGDKVVADFYITVLKVCEIVAVTFDFHEVATAEIRTGCYIERPYREGIDIEDYITLCTTETCFQVNFAVRIVTLCCIDSDIIGVAEREVGEH